MRPIEQVNDFLTQSGTFYLTTVDGDRPKCRPVAFHMLSGEHIYFGVGDFKEVYRQMRQNPPRGVLRTGESGIPALLRDRRF